MAWTDRKKQKNSGTACRDVIVPLAQLWAKSVRAIRLRALPFSLVHQGCFRVGVSRCGLAAVVGRGW